MNTESLQYIYFYHTTSESKERFSTTHTSGILQWGRKIDSHEELMKAKSLIAKINDLNYSTLIIESFNFLHEKDAENE